MEFQGNLFGKKKRLRFKEEDDIELLREVASQNPFDNPQLWTAIEENVAILTGKHFSLKTLKEHLDLVIRAWKEKTKILEKKSGIHEDYTEKDQLCQNIFDYMMIFRGKKAEKEKKQQEIMMAKEDRDNWASLQQVEMIEIDVVPCEETNTVAEDDIVMAPTTPVTLPQPSNIERRNKSRKRKINVQRQGLAYLEQYDREQFAAKIKDQELEEKRIALESRKLDLEEKKFALQQAERQQQMEILQQMLISQKEHRNEMSKIIERQDKLINFLINKKE